MAGLCPCDKCCAMHGCLLSRKSRKRSTTAWVLGGVFDSVNWGDFSMCQKGGFLVGPCGHQGLSLTCTCHNLLVMSSGERSGILFVSRAAIERLAVFVPKIFLSALGLDFILTTSALLFSAAKNKKPWRCISNLAWDMVVAKRKNAEFPMNMRGQFWNWYKFWRV